MKRKEIQEAIKDVEWQEFRETLKGLSTRKKLIELKKWKTKKGFSKKSLIQVENYLNALKRGGII